MKGAAAASSAATGLLVLADNLKGNARKWQRSFGSRCPRLGTAFRVRLNVSSRNHANGECTRRLG
jgi:hypothetical protein